MVLLGNGTCKVRKCKIVFLSENPEGMLKFFDPKKFDSEAAFDWAIHVGNRDIMIDRITESCWAWNWIIDIGDKEKMLKKFPQLDGISENF